MKPIDIGQTVLEKIDVMPHFLLLHVISGCDTVSKIHGIGKTTTLGVLKSGHVPPPLGNLRVSQEQLVKQGTFFHRGLLWKLTFCNDYVGTPVSEMEKCDQGQRQEVDPGCTIGGHDP